MNLLMLTVLLFSGCCNCNGGVVNMQSDMPNSSPLDSVSSDWGYETVRQDAHMFWWLFYYDDSYQPSFLPPLDPIPVIVWLQGGPGGSGVGFGNFEELGPLDLNLNRRETSWTGLGHILFVDNPVGTGYSYVTNPDAYTTNVDEIATDMVTLLKGFYSHHPELEANPFYIFCESYGGKMAAATALAITKEVENGTMNLNLQGVGLGDSWISPIDSTTTWAEYLYQTSLLDESGKAAVEKAAQMTQDAVDAGNWTKATNLWSFTEGVVMLKTDNVDFYNILNPHHTTATRRIREKELRKRVPAELVNAYAIHVDTYAADPLDVLMNTYVKQYLNISSEVTWGGQSDDVFNYQSGDFMKPVIDIVDELIASGIKVVVYNGQLDLIVDTPGQKLWMKKLGWNKAQDFFDQSWKAEVAYTGQDTGGFSKRLENVQFWWILKAGHMVPLDQGEFMLHILYTTITS